MNISKTIQMPDESVKRHIEDVAARTNLGEIKTIQWLAAGYISNAYEFETDQGAYVLLQHKPTAAKDVGYGNYFANLRAVEAAGYAHAPKAVHISEDNEIIVVTKVPGQTAEDVSNLSEADQRTVAFSIVKALRELAAVRKDEVEMAYSSLGFSAPLVMSEDEDWKVYVLDRFEPYKATAPADARTEWIEKVLEDHEPKPRHTGICYHHGDTSAQNIIIGEDLKITLIDWGDSGFYESSPEIEEYGLCYTFNHVPIMRKYKEQILLDLCEQSGHDYETYSNRIYDRCKDIKIADITWAYWMYCQTSSGAIAEPSEKYKKILYQRINEFEDQFTF